MAACTLLRSFCRFVITFLFIACFPFEVDSAESVLELHDGKIFILESPEGLDSPVSVGRAFDRLTFRVRLKDNHASPARRYRVEDGSESVSMPGWSLRFLDSVGNGFVVARKGSLSVVNGEERNDLQLVVERFPDGMPLASVPLPSSETFSSESSLMLEQDGEEWSLSTGDNGLEKRLDFSFPAFVLDSVSLLPGPGGEVESSFLFLMGERRFPKPSEENVSLASDALKNGFPRNPDEPLCGIWREYDRTLDESRLKSGGRYRILIHKAGKGYEGLYLEGSKVNPGDWKPGMVKLRLIPVGVEGEFDVVWIDAEGRALRQDLRALLDPGNGLLNIVFPYQDSSIRLRAED